MPRPGRQTRTPPGCARRSRRPRPAGAAGHAPAAATGQPQPPRSFAHGQHWADAASPASWSPTAAPCAGRPNTAATLRAEPFSALIRNVSNPAVGGGHRLGERTSKATLDLTHAPPPSRLLPPARVPLARPALKICNGNHARTPRLPPTHPMVCTHAGNRRLVSRLCTATSLCEARFTAEVSTYRTSLVRALNDTDGQIGRCRMLPIPGTDSCRFAPPVAPP